MGRFNEFLLWCMIAECLESKLSILMVWNFVNGKKCTVDTSIWMVTDRCKCIQIHECVVVIRLCSRFHSNAQVLLSSSSTLFVLWAWALMTFSWGSSQRCLNRSFEKANRAAASRKHREISVILQNKWNLQGKYNTHKHRMFNPER